jgi:hypothetical protein
VTGSKEFLLKVPSMASPVVTSVSGNEKLLMENIPAKHCLVYNEGMKARHCGYCKMMRSKTSCGWHVKSYYRCPACDVALCSGKSFSLKNVESGVKHHQTSKNKATSHVRLFISKKFFNRFIIH